MTILLCEPGDHSAEEVFECRACGAMFCEKHGNIQAELCNNCSEEKDPYVDEPPEGFDADKEDE